MSRFVSHNFVAVVAVRVRLCSLSSACALDVVRVERSFILDNGQLLVYRDHHPNAKVKATTVNNGEDLLVLRFQKKHAVAHRNILEHIFERNGF